jgi:hypothetical protein
MPCRLRSSPAQPRAATSVAGAGGARASWHGAGSYPDNRNRLARPSLPYVAYECFKCFKHFRCTLQLFHLDVAKVDWGILHMLHMLQVFQRHVASACSKYFICFHTSVAIFFYLDIAYVSHICCNSMFQMFQLFQSYIAASGFMLQV